MRSPRPLQHAGASGRNCGRQGRTPPTREVGRCCWRRGYPSGSRVRRTPPRRVWSTLWFVCAVHGKSSLLTPKQVTRGVRDVYGFVDFLAELDRKPCPLQGCFLCVLGDLFRQYMAVAIDPLAVGQVYCCSSSVSTAPVVGGCVRCGCQARDDRGGGRPLGGGGEQAGEQAADHAAPPTYSSHVASSSSTTSASATSSDSCERATNASRTFSASAEVSRFVVGISRPVASAYSASPSSRPIFRSRMRPAISAFCSEVTICSEAG